MNNNIYLFPFSGCGGVINYSEWKITPLLVSAFVWYEESESVVLQDLGGCLNPLRPTLLDPVDLHNFSDLNQHGFSLTTVIISTFPMLLDCSEWDIRSVVTVSWYFKSQDKRKCVVRASAAWKLHRNVREYSSRHQIHRKFYENYQWKVLWEALT